MTALQNHRREVALAGLWHDYANLFPMLAAEAQDALRADILAHGVREPIILFGGRILDGRNRYMAARDLGLDFPVAEFIGTDSEALAYVLSTNLHRRHLTESQRAAIAAKLANLDHGSTERFSQEANLPLGEARVSMTDAAAMLNVSRRSVVDAKAVLASGSEGLMQSVERGEVSVSAAATVARLPQEEQAEAVSAGPKAIVAKAKEARQAKRTPEAPSERPADPYGYARLTEAALLDLANGLRADLDEAKAMIAKFKAALEELKADLAAYQQGDMGRALGNAQRAAKTAQGRMAEYQAQAVRAEARARHLQAELDAMRKSAEAQVIPL